jgi:pimeloyl-ACP methyl ester carboxylesterase
MTKIFQIVTFCLLLSIFSITALAQSAGKPPLIIIPGITGSELVNSETGEIVWFTLKHSKGDELRLPMSPDLKRNRDNIVAKDILREVKLPGVLPDIEVYQPVLDFLKTQGYSEASWNNPQAEDVFYVFSYDWRRDNVESAQELIKRMEAAKQQLKKPNLKFEIIAHSMGGLIARYAAMYGAADLVPERRRPVPNWYGAKHISKILMFGTPNDGSFNAFAALLNGYDLGGVNLPFIDDLDKEDAFTIPSLFQLMPHGSSARFLNQNLDLINVDIYQPATWKKYGWSAISDPSFLGKLKDAENLNVKIVKRKKEESLDDKLLAETTFEQVDKYFTEVLSRARRFHQALDVVLTNSPVEIMAFGSDCKPTLDAIVVYRDKEKARWVTITKPRDIKMSDGEKVTEEEVRVAMYSPGDGNVTRRSLLVDNVFSKLRTAYTEKGQPPIYSFFFCAPHHRLLGSKPIQEAFFPLLSIKK